MFKGSYAGNFRFTNGHAFAAERIEFRTGREDPSVAASLESLESKERPNRAASLESAIPQRRGHHSGRFLQMLSQPWFESIIQLP
jgi:hypothetical protein